MGPPGLALEKGGSVLASESPMVVLAASQGPVLCFTGVGVGETGVGAGVGTTWVGVGATGLGGGETGVDSGVGVSGIKGVGVGATPGLPLEKQGSVPALVSQASVLAASWV